MVKSSTLKLRIDKELKDEANKVLESLGLTLSTAVDMYLQQIVLTKSIPFELKVSEDNYLRKLSEGEIISLISEAIEEYETTKNTTS